MSIFDRIFYKYKTAITSGSRQEMENMNTFTQKEEKEKNVSRVSEFRTSLNIWQKSFKLFLLPFANHLHWSCENYDWQCLSPLHWYNKDFWRSKGCMNHITIEPLDFCWSWSQYFKVFSLYQVRMEAKTNYVLKYIRVFLSWCICFFRNGYRDRGNFGTQFIRSMLNNCSSMTRFLLQKCYL